MHSKRTLLAAGGACLLAICLGFGCLLDNAYAPGDGGDAPPTWPTSTSLRREVGRPALIVVVHPRCPCSRATLRELERLLARISAPVSTTVVFVKPPGADEAWQGAGLRDLAEAIPGVVVVDDEGEEARRFGAQTSGQAYLYDAAGRLRFSGGLTSARGHEGESVGQVAIADALRDSEAGAFTSLARVFGCGLF